MSARPLTSRAMLARADVLLLLAGLLREAGHVTLPTTTETLQMLRAAGMERDGLPEAVETLVEAARATSVESWRREYHRLFEGAIACPVNEAAYIRRDKGALLADISGFYRAFGLDLASGTGERVDHLRCELEFVAMLLFLMAQARDRGEAEHERVTVDAMRRFAADHLGEWLSSFCAHLRGTTELELFRRWADVGEGMFEELAGAFSLPATPNREPIAPAREPEEWSSECGGGASSTPCQLTIDGR